MKRRPAKSRRGKPLVEHSALNPQPAAGAYNHQYDPTPGAHPGPGFQTEPGVGGMAGTDTPGPDMESPT